MKKMADARFVLVTLLLPFAAYAAVSWYGDRFGQLPVYGPALSGTGQKSVQQLQAVTLLNQENDPTGTEAWDGKIAVVNFFFTHCPAVCPKMTLNLKEVQQAYKDDGQVIIRSLTVDPEHDSVPRLSQYARRYGIQNNRWQLLTGNKQDIYRLARNRFGVVATDGDGGPTDFIHSDKLVLVDPQKRIRGYYNGTDKEEVHQLIEDIKKLKHEN